MFKTFIFLFIITPLSCLAQLSISGRILNQADTKPVANASVFLSNATIGSTTAADGTFTLKNIKAGKYDLVISIIGFDTYNQTVIINNKNISLPDIMIFPKTIALNEVKIKPRDDPYREKYLNWFKDEFLGTSLLARDCKILNPDVLDLSYDEAAHKLTASSYDFLQIENDALGYKVKYLLTDFTLEIKDEDHKTINYKGAVLFQELKGRPSEERRWQRNRLEVYKNSPMHFLRAAVSHRLNEDGFRVQEMITYDNPDRPSDSLIDAKIKFYKQAKLTNTYLNDPEAVWRATLKLPKKLKKTITLKEQDLIRTTDQPGIYVLSGDTGGMFVAYNKSHHYHIKNALDYLYNYSNNENTLIKFNVRNALFYKNGVMENPYSVRYYGVWGRSRVAEMLPIDYEPPQGADMPDDNIIDNLTSRFEAYTASHQTEKAYLHFDKPYYAAGDTMYFKAYVTRGEKHALSNLSGVLHIDLINTNNKIDQCIKLQLTDGVAWGDFALPDSLTKGSYRVRAYTNWMRNSGDEAYFDRPVPLGSELNNRIPESGNYTKTSIKNKPDISFLPEGGTLVAGIRSKVAFKAIGPNGLGINVKGEIIDDQNKTITAFSSARLGMGYFYISPKEGRTYKAKVAYADGTQNMFDLPAAEPSGIVLSVNNDSLPKASVRIEADKAFYQANKNKDFNLLIYSGGDIKTIPCTLDSQVVTLDILKHHLQTGVAAVTLFSPAREPLCERLLFVQNYGWLNLGISSDKPIYAKREKVNIKLNIKDRADSASSGHFSVSVTDESKVPVDVNGENTILSNLLLTSDLKGYVEQPGYYFTNITDKTNRDLDLVMLTHGYRMFEWKKLLNNEYPPVAYQPERGLIITGIAKNGFGRPLVNGTVSLINPKGGSVFSTKTDEKGNFSFNNLAFTDSAKFILQAVNSKGKSSTTLVYNKETVAPMVTAAPLLQDSALNQPKAAYLENSLKQHDQAIQYGKANGIMLKEVKIRQNKKHIIDESYRSSSLLGPGHADQVMHRKEIEQIGGQLSTSLDGRLRGVGFIRTPDGKNVAFLRAPPSDGPMLVVVDGVKENVQGDKTKPFDINQISSSQIETVEVLRFASASIYGMEGGNGVLVITTRQGGQDPKDIQAVGILPITVNGFYKAREFYAPKYEHPTDDFKKPDLRSTVYWKPELITGKDGNASFDFFNADGTGTYRVVVEGIDKNGNIGRQVYKYKVE